MMPTLTPPRPIADPVGICSPLDTPKGLARGYSLLRASALAARVSERGYNPLVCSRDRPRDEQ